MPQENEPSVENIEIAKEMIRRIIDKLSGKELLENERLLTTKERAVAEFRRSALAQEETPVRAYDVLDEIWDVASQSEDKSAGLQVAVLVMNAGISLESGRTREFIDEINSALFSLRQTMYDPDYAENPNYKDAEKELQDLIDQFENPEE